MRGLLVGAALLLAPAVQAATTAELAAALVGVDDARAAEAARALGQSKEPAALQALVEALAQGAPPKVAVAILPALAGRRDARAVEQIVACTHHRAPEVRKAALAALTTVEDPRVTPALLAALGDSDAEVRAKAAEVVAARRERAAEDRLIKLMEHKDASSAAALAAIATPALAHRLSELLGQVSDDILCTTFGLMLKRADFGPDPIRVEVVRTLSKVPGADSTAVLVEYLAATEKDKDRPSRIEAQKIVDARSQP